MATNYAWFSLQVLHWPNKRTTNRWRKVAKYFPRGVQQRVCGQPTMTPCEKGKLTIDSEKFNQSESRIFEAVNYYLTILNLLSFKQPSHIFVLQKYLMD